MPVPIVSASGAQYGAGVDEYNRLLVNAVISGVPTVNANITGSIMIGSVSAQVDSIYIQSGAQVEVYGSGLFIGSITSMPAVSVSVSAGSESYIKGGSIEVYTGSIYVTNFSAGTGYAGSDAYVPAGSVIITNTITGSITSMPNVTISNPSTIGSYTTQEILGSVAITSPINVTVGSESYIKGGSLTIWTGSIYLKSGTTYVDVANTVQVAGSIWSIPDVQASLTGSLEVFSSTGSVEVYGTLSATAGSQMWIMNPVGISGINDIGSVVIKSAPRLGVSGIVDIQTRVAGSIVDMPIVAISGTKLGDLTGSFAVTTNVLPVSGTLFHDIIGSVQINTGSVRAQVVQITTPWQVAGSIWSIPDISVTTGSESWIKGGSIIVWGGSIYLQSGTTYIDVVNRVAGSIVNMPIVGISGTNFSEMIGSVRAQSVQITNPWVISGNVLVSGLININNPASIGSWTGYVGSIWSMPNISVSVGSEQWIKGGSIQTYTPLGSTFVLGSIYVTGSVNMATTVLPVSGTLFQNILGSVQVNAGSVAITTALLPISGNVLVSGLVGIRNPETIGSWTGYVGSIWSMPTINVAVGSEQWIMNPVGISGTNVIGSVVIMSAPLLGVSGAIFTGGDIVGSVVIKSSNLLGISGPVWIQNPVGISGVNDIGSVVIKSAPLLGVSGAIFTGGNITGSFVISSAPLLGISGVIFTDGNMIGSTIIKSSVVLGVSGNINVSTGSTIILNEIVISNVGSPCFKQAIAIASGTYTQVWSIGGAGSRVEVHGYHISTNLAGIVIIVGSATTPNLINANYLNFASGATIEKTFCNPIIPRGADVPLGFQTTSAGSTAVTIYGREVK